MVWGLMALAAIMLIIWRFLSSSIFFRCSVVRWISPCMTICLAISITSCVLNVLSISFSAGRSPALAFSKTSSTASTFSMSISSPFFMDKAASGSTYTSNCFPPFLSLAITALSSVTMIKPTICIEIGYSSPVSSSVSSPVFSSLSVSSASSVPVSSSPEWASSITLT